MIHLKFYNLKINIIKNSNLIHFNYNFFKKLVKIIKLK